MANSGPLRITVVFSPAPRQVEERLLELPPGSTVGQAIAASEILRGVASTVVDTLECGVWGRKAPVNHRLRDRDRVEVYRELTVDPKEARRLRFAGQGTKVAGLFRKRRAGAKPGY